MDHKGRYQDYNITKLQVLGGTARRKKLLSPKSMDVRPMMEVVKGAAFGILQVLFPVLPLMNKYINFVLK